MNEMLPLTRRVRTEAEAVAAAMAFRDRIAKGAARRDRERRVPTAEIAAMADTGLWAITVPAALGGADVSHATLAEVIALLAEGDASVAAIPHGHFTLLEILRHAATPEQQREQFARVLRGDRFALLNVESGTPTRLGDDGFSLRLEGRKPATAGALTADLLGVTARDEAGRLILALVAHDADGLTVRDDWPGMGQRTAAGGAAILDGVTVAKRHVLPLHTAFARLKPPAAFAQMLHAAIELGIARAALRTAATLARADSSEPRARDDNLLLDRFGRLQVHVHAAEAMLRRAATALDAARAAPGEAADAGAAIAVAEAKTLTAEAALAAATALFDLTGGASASDDTGLDRFWRDARAQTLRDPARWKYHAIANYHLNGVKPQPYL